MITIGIDVGSRYTKIIAPHTKSIYPSLLTPPAVFGQTKYVHLPKPVEVFIDSSPPVCISSLSTTGGYTILDSHDFIPTIVLAFVGLMVEGSVNIVLGVPYYIKDFDRICLDIEGRHSITYKKGEVQKQKEIAVRNVEIFTSTLGAQKEGYGVIDVGYGKVCLCYKDDITPLPVSFENVLDEVLKEVNMPKTELEQNVSNIYSQVFRNATVEILKYAVAKWRRNPPQKVIITGGGAEAIKNYVSHSNFVIPKEPIFYNLVGLLEKQKVTQQQ